MSKRWRSRRPHVLLAASAGLAVTAYSGVFLSGCGPPNGSPCNYGEAGTQGGCVPAASPGDDAPSDVGPDTSADAARE